MFYIIVNGCLRLEVLVGEGLDPSLPGRSTSLRLVVMLAKPAVHLGLALADIHVEVGRTAVVSTAATGPRAAPLRPQDRVADQDSGVLVVIRIYIWKVGSGFKISLKAIFLQIYLHF